LKDVARHAGVSITTVSQVVNNSTGGNIRISQETRDRVWQAVQALGYTPNASARSLRTRKTNLLAVLVPDIANPFYPQLIRGIQDVASEHGYDLLVYDADDRPEREKTFVEAILRRQVEGVAMVPFYLGRADFERITQANIAVAIMTSTPPPMPGVDVLQVDDTQALGAMLDHLISKGHRRIAHLSGVLGTIAGDCRLAGYRRALERAGIPFDESLVCIGNFRAGCVPGLIEQLFAQAKQPPTAIFAANDVMAIATIYDLKRRGLRVPDDIAVCGYDNIPEAGMMIPALTTIDQQMQQEGQMLARLLIERLESKNKLVERAIPLEFRLVIRDST
jgi:DNA-binding LacI/PurR family transcriptional regulator